MSSLLHQHRIKIRSLTRTGGGQNFMVWWCAFWTPSCYWIPCGRERISDKYSHAVRQCTVHAVDKSIVCHWASWIPGFEKGQTQFSDKHPSGQPTPVTTVLLPSVDKLTHNNHRIMTRKLTPETSVFKGSVKEIIQAWWYWKVYTCRVPKGLTNYL
jgi:hypothetical protein